MVKEISMVERVAKVICCSADGYCKHPDECMVNDFGYFDAAKRAIIAMRNPSDVMICAVLDAHDKASPRTTRVIEDWQTMIDEALK